MLKTVDIVLVALMLCATAWTFGVKHEAELIEEELRLVERQIAHERETIALLEADWSLLNQPYRLQRLTTAFEAELGLKPFEPTQIVGPHELPAPPLVVVPEADQPFGDLAAATVPGSVR